MTVVIYTSQDIEALTNHAADLLDELRQILGEMTQGLDRLAPIELTVSKGDDDDAATS